MNRISSLRKTGQPLRDLGCLSILVVAVAYYFQNLGGYLVALQKPMVLEIGFAGSLAISLLYDINRNNIRFSLIHATRTAIVFAVGVMVAHYLRDKYLILRDQIASIHELRELWGEDIHSALMNQVVGYGGCFALGMVSMRITIGRAIERGLIAVFVLPQLMPSTCPHCKQLVHH